MANRCGNLILGYNATTAGAVRTGSHNLVIGDGHTYTDAAGMVAGKENKITSYCATVTGGMRNEASGLYSSVTGGGLNTAAGRYSSVSGGHRNAATNYYSIVSGGFLNRAGYNSSTILGGAGNTANSEGQCLGDSFSLPRFVDNGDGTVTDKRTGLMWQKATAPETYKWQEAKSYCANLELAGHKDWRLPNKTELRRLIDMSKEDPPLIDPVFYCESSWYWSSSTSSNNTAYAWRVHFAGGNVNDTFKAYELYVRAVRG